MDARLLFPNEYLCAADMAGKDVTLTISRLSQEALRTDKGDEDKWVLFFAEMEERHRQNKKKINKRLVLNKTNAKTIIKLYGTETNNWIGRAITIYATTCMAFGQQVDCVRIRDRVPGKKANGSKRSAADDGAELAAHLDAPPPEVYDGPPDDLEMGA